MRLAATYRGSRRNRYRAISPNGIRDWPGIEPGVRRRKPRNARKLKHKTTVPPPLPPLLVVLMLKAKMFNKVRAA
jgi:hypothetical protein